MKKLLALVITLLLMVPSFFMTSTADDIEPLDDVTEGWLYRKQITLNHSQVPSTLSNFPVLINITDIDLRDHAQSDGDDICFFNSTGTKLNHEIELYTNTTGRLIAWVNVTSLSSSADTVIYMYYGNSTCGSQQNAEGTWDSHYVMVQHMNDTTTSTIKDSTVNNNDGTKKGANEPLQVDGKIGKGQDFDGSNDKINTVSLNNAANLTVSAIIKMDADSGWIVNKRDNAADIQWQFLHSGGKLIANLFIGTSTVAGIVDDGASCLGGDYHHVAFTTTGVTGGSLILYKDGGVTGTPATLTGNMKLGSRDVVIGMTAWVDWATGAFDGLIDEVRISNIARSADWIKTEYNNMVNAIDGGFFTMGDEQLLIFVIDENPADNSENVTGLLTEWSAYIDSPIDTSGTIECSNGDNMSWSNEPEGTQTLTFTDWLDYNTTYDVWLNISAGSVYVNETFDFKTTTCKITGTIETGWNTFGNTSTWKDLTTGWNTFGNQNYTIFYAVYPEDNDTVDPASFTFMVNISDTNGTAMNVSWEYWDGASWVLFGSNLTSAGNGTYYKLPSPWFDLYGVNYTYRVTVEGNQTVNRTITFHTIDAPPSTSIIEFDATQFSAFLCVILFLFFFVIGYITTKQSSGLFMFIGAWHLISFGVLAAGWSLVFIPFIVPASIYAMVLGIWKFMRIRREHQAAQGRIIGR